MTGTDPAEGRIEDRLVQRVRHLADQPQGRVTRHPGVGIERQNVAHTGGHGWHMTLCRAVVGIIGTAQQTVELVQLAAFALPSHPNLFGGVVTAVTMQVQKAGTGGTRAVDLVQSGNLDVDQRDKWRILRHVLSGGVQPVGQDCKSHVSLGAGQIMDFQPFELFGQLCAICQHCRHNHERAQRRRHAALKRQSRQCRGRYGPGHHAINDKLSDGAGRDDRCEEPERKHGP